MKYNYLLCKTCHLAPTFIQDTYVSKVVVDNILLYAKDQTPYWPTWNVLLKCYYNTKLMSNLRSVNSSNPSWNVLELSSHPMATNLLDLNYQLF